MPDTALRSRAVSRIRGRHSRPTAGSLSCLMAQSLQTHNNFSSDAEHDSAVHIP